ncbi:YcnI family copper-binding membrane protein [Marisediminicola senii]|uniref:YcnI family copper-binding membrane protein n=1 Tax=Marisediminicola senii TaxID=2711233 RepID=UPI0013E9BAFC|nr:YcnI family protein [Marisediminicola senii]
MTRTTRIARTTRTARTARRTVGTVTGVAAAGLLIALAAPMTASAHVGVEASTTAAGSYSLLTFSVPHGCDASSTTGITIDIPESVISVTPTINPGWTVEAVSTDDRTSQVVYTAETPLPDGYRDAFELEVALPDGEPGDMVAFPVTQACEVGETLWNEETVEGEDEPAHPAPAIVLTAASEGEGHHGAADGVDAASASSSAEASTAPTSDTLARVFGIGGLLVGAVAVVVATAAVRRKA